MAYVKPCITALDATTEHAGCRPCDGGITASALAALGITTGQPVSPRCPAPILPTVPTVCVKSFGVQVGEQQVTVRGFCVTTAQVGEVSISGVGSILP